MATASRGSSAPTSERSKTPCGTPLFSDFFVSTREGGRRRSAMGAPSSALNPFVLVLSGDGSILRWSPSFRHHALQPLDALLGNLSWELLFQESDAKVIGSFLSRNRGERVETREDSWTTHGDPFDTSWSVLAIASPSGTVEFVVVTGVQKTPSAAPPSARPPHHRLLLDTPFDMWAFDRRTYRLLAANRATSRRLGHTQEELLSMRVLDLIPWEYVPRLVALITDLKAGQSAEARWPHQRKDGLHLDIETEVVAVESEGLPACLVLSRAAAQR